MSDIRHDWTVDEVEAMLDRSFSDLIFNAQKIHRAHHDTDTVQVASLLSIKTGGCPEDCKYCPQSVHYNAGVDAHALMKTEDILEAASAAKAQGASRFCMGAAWRSPTSRQIDQLAPIIEAVNDLGMESCVTLGMLNESHAKRLASAGLHYYNHNLDTSPEYYKEIISTRTYDDRLETLQHVRDAGISVCSGGIVGMGEARKDRAGMLVELANLPKHPESVPINLLVRVEGTPLSDELADEPELDSFEFVRTIAAARIMMPESFVRLSAGRRELTREAQALCFMAGANSIFGGDKLLTTPNPEQDEDAQLFKTLGLNATA